jgi:hypothetical protein
VVVGRALEPRVCVCVCVCVCAFQPCPKRRLHALLSRACSGMDLLEFILFSLFLILFCLAVTRFVVRLA